MRRFFLYTGNKRRRGACLQDVRGLMNRENASRPTLRLSEIYFQSRQPITLQMAECLVEYAHLMFDMLSRHADATLILCQMLPLPDAAALSRLSSISIRHHYRLIITLHFRCHRCLIIDFLISAIMPLSFSLMPCRCHFHFSRHSIGHEYRSFSMMNVTDFIPRLSVISQAATSIG